MNHDFETSPSPSSGNDGNAGVATPDWRALWFDLDPVARLVVARDLTVLAANQGAVTLVDGHEAVSIRDGVLAAKDRRAATQLAEAVADAGPARRLSVVGGSHCGPGVLVETLSLDGRRDGPIGMTLRDLAATAYIECADLEAIFGVTPGEHQVVVQLLKGYSSREIAAQSGKSILTIRTHVKRAYGKIGVKTRGQLFARLLPYLSIR